jgi:hypothetical protein
MDRREYEKELNHYGEVLPAQDGQWARLRAWMISPARQRLEKVQARWRRHRRLSLELIETSRSLVESTRPRLRQGAMTAITPVRALLPLLLSPACLLLF